MSIETPEEFQGLRAAGLVVRRTLEAMKRAVKPGITTAQVDEAGAAVIWQECARPAPAMVYKFPGVNLISVNDEVVHGIPSGRKLREGDLVKLDVTIEKDGFMADSAVTIGVGKISDEKRRLAGCAERAFHMGARVARAGVRLREVGRVIEDEVRRSGFFVIRELGGHGIGRTIHEPPSVPNFADPSSQEVLNEGLVLTIEPIIATRSGKVFLDPDGWTVRTADRGAAAHYEHTLVITKNLPVLLTGE